MMLDGCGRFIVFRASEEPAGCIASCQIAMQQIMTSTLAVKFNKFLRYYMP